MKFIFPQNYNLRPKILGIIDYWTALLDVVWGGAILILLNFFIERLTTRIFLFIILVFPILIFSIAGVNGENLMYVISYVLKYLCKQKVFLYQKNNKV